MMVGLGAGALACGREPSGNGRGQEDGNAHSARVKGPGKTSTPGKSPGALVAHKPKLSTLMHAESLGKEPSLPALGDDVREIEIPAQTLLVGSRTGLPGRDPTSEMDLVPMKIGSFTIDRFPYPNEKGAAPRTGVSVDEARGLCEAGGRRLCTELEWEAACKGGVNSQYPYSQAYDASLYGQGLEALLSGYGVAGMGAILEWTDSIFMLPENPAPKGRVMRGAAPDEGPHARRCASRSSRMDEGASSTVGFRCCSGARNEAEVILEPLEKPFSEVKDMAPEKFSELVNAIPELMPVHGEASLFGETDLDYVLLRRNIDPRKSYPGYIFTKNPVWWHPMRGEELLAFVGYAREDSFVAALYHLGDGRFRHAASMVLLGNTDTSIKVPLPIILVAGVDRDVLNWGPCWNCSEGGALYIEEGTNSIQVSHRW